MTDRAVVRDRLVFLHGFTQTHHHWHRVAHAVAARLGTSPTTAFVDLPGHGLAADDRDGVEQAVAGLPGLGGRGTWVGYSMGGRFALAAAARGAGEIERLVLVGATAGLADASERSERRRADAARADRLERIGVEAFVEEWLALPLFAGLPDDAEGVAHRCRNTVAGLAHSLRTCGTGSQPSVWDDLAGVTIPVLVVVGERDAKFTAIGRRLVDALPVATMATIDGAGHAAHTEQPDNTADVIADWSHTARPTASSAP